MVALEIASAFNDARCRPPLSDDELLLIVDSIAALGTDKTRHSMSDGEGSNDIRTYQKSSVPTHQKN